MTNWPGRIDQRIYYTVLISWHSLRKKHSLPLGNSERNDLLKPESRQNGLGYVEPADAIAYKPAIISIRQFWSNPAPNNYRHREPGWPQTPAAGTYDLRRPIERNESYQTTDKRFLISFSADNWTQRFCTKDKTKKGPWAKPVRSTRIIIKKARYG